MILSNKAQVAIRNLLVQVGLSDSDLVQKFAELLVKQCADAADMAQECNCKYAGDYVVEQMGLGVNEGAADWRCK